MKKTKPQFAQVEKLLKELKKAKPKKGLDLMFTKNLKSKLRKQYLLAEDEKSILDRVIEGLTAWSKMPVASALGAGVAVFLIVMQFGPEASIEEVRKELKIQQSSKTEELKTDKKVNATPAIGQDKVQFKVEGDNQNQTDTPNINISHQDKIKKSSPTDKEYLQHDVGSQDDDSDNFVDDYQGEEGSINYITNPGEGNYNSGGGASGGASLADTPTITLQMEVFGNVNEQIAALQTELSNISGLENVETVVYNDELGNIELTLSPEQIDSLTNQLRTRSYDREIDGENYLRNLDTTNVTKIKVRITIMRVREETPETTTPQVETREEENLPEEESTTETDTAPVRE